MKKIISKTMLMGGLLVVLSGGLVSCTTIKRGEVAREWSLMMREQQIAPIFPPREDIRIGDVYLTRENPNTPDTFLKSINDRDFLEIPLLFYRTNLESGLTLAYSNRPAYPLTPGSILVPVITTETNQTTATNITTVHVVSTNFTTTIVISNSIASTNLVGLLVTNPVAVTQLYTKTNVSNVTNLVAMPSGVEPLDSGLYTNSRPDRLRHVGFPEFSFAKVSTASLQGVVPIEGVNVAFAETMANAQDGFVKISSGESISLPFAEVFASVQGGLCKTGTNVLNPNLNDLVNSLAKSDPTDRRQSPTNSFYLTIISEVFYARTIDVGFTAKKSPGGGVNAGGRPSTNLPSLKAAAADRAQALSIMNNELLSQVTPGGSLTYTAASDFGIGLRRTYTRPIAVGYRGVVIRLEQTNGMDWKMGAMRVAETWKPVAIPAN